MFTTLQPPIKPRACPRCNGAVLDNDAYDEQACLNCGWRRPDHRVDPVGRLIERVGMSLVAAGSGKVNGRRKYPRRKKVA